MFKEIEKELGEISMEKRGRGKNQKKIRTEKYCFNIFHSVDFMSDWRLQKIPQLWGQEE